MVLIFCETCVLRIANSDEYAARHGFAPGTRVLFQGNCVLSAGLLDYHGDPVQAVHIIGAADPAIPPEEQDLGNPQALQRVLTVLH